VSADVLDALSLFLLALVIALLGAFLFAIYRSPRLSREAKEALNELAGQIAGDLRQAASSSIRAIRRQKVDRRDIRSEYQQRRRDGTFVIGDKSRVVGGLIYGTVSFGVAIQPLPIFPTVPYPVAWSLAAAFLAAFGVALPLLSLVHLLRAGHRRRSALVLTVAGAGAPVVSKSAVRQSLRCGMRLARAVRKQARSAARSAPADQGLIAEITGDEIRSALPFVVRSGARADARPAAAPRGALALAVTGIPVLAVLVTVIAELLIRELPLERYGKAVLILGVLLLLYLLLTKSRTPIVRFWEGLPGVWEGFVGVLGRLPNPFRHLRFPKLSRLGGGTASVRPERPALAGAAPASAQHEASPAPALPGPPPSPALPGPPPSPAHHGAAAAPAQHEDRADSRRQEDIAMTDVDNKADSGQTPPAAGDSFSLGWLMAQLYGPLQRPRGTETTHLPTVAELDTDEQMALAFVELKHLLSPYSTLSNTDVESAWKAAGHQGFAASVMALHLDLLAQLIDDPGQLSAYQLGRALSDTCWLPDEAAGPDFFLREFSHYRLATLQTWLGQASGTLPDEASAIVGRSMQNWQDWAEVNARTIRSRWPTVHRTVIAALRTQAGAWHAVLAGVPDAVSATSPDAWTQAGESILRTTRTLTLAILRRFWPVVVVLVAATGGLLYLALANTSGTAKVWTSIVTVAAGLGVSGASLRATAKKAASGVEKDIWRAASLDAQAWNVTWLPTVRQNRIKKTRLARRGVAAPQATKKLERSAPAGPVSQQLPPQLPQEAT